MSVVLSSVVLALIASGLPVDDDRPFVEILQSTGALDGPSESGMQVPRWERVRLELRIINRTPTVVGELELEISLVSLGGGPSANAIPGWSFREKLADQTIDANEEVFVRFNHELPARRSSPPADEITYRVRIHSYRLLRPELETALELLSSPQAFDQRAALQSYRLPEATPRTVRTRRAAGLVDAIALLPAAPKASDALRLLFSIQALGLLGDSAHVPLLLDIPDGLDQAVWGRAVIDLATRMVAASTPDEPRLRVLPTWAREPGALVRVRAQDALNDAVREAILRMGDAAVPSLLEQSHRAKRPQIRARAARLLHALGRSTVRSQLALNDDAARLEAIDVMGRIGSAAPVSALLELLRDRDAQVRAHAARALERIGADAIGPLVGGLGGGQDELVLEVLTKIATKNPRGLSEAAGRYGVVRARGESVAECLGRLRAHLSDERRVRLRAEVERALQIGHEGGFRDAFRMLDRVFAQDRKIYMERSREIEGVYSARANQLFERGDYDACAATVRTGLSIHPNVNSEVLLCEAMFALARGFIELDDLKNASARIEQMPDRCDLGTLRDLQASLLTLRAQHAIEDGDYGSARTFIDRARAKGAKDPALVLADRRLLLSENIAIVAVLLLLIPGILLAIVLLIRRRLERKRVHRLATAIDRGESRVDDPQPTQP